MNGGEMQHLKVKSVADLTMKVIELNTENQLLRHRLAALERALDRAKECVKFLCEWENSEGPTPDAQAAVRDYDEAIAALDIAGEAKG